MCIWCSSITAYVTGSETFDPVSELGDNESYRSSALPNFTGSLNHGDSHVGFVIPNRRPLQRIVTSKDNKRPPSLSFHNITYTIEQRRNYIGTAESHTILKGVRSVMSYIVYHHTLC